MITIASSNFIAPTTNYQVHEDIDHFTHKTLLPGEKLVVAGSTLINRTDRPIQIRYFGPADIEADIRDKEDFDLIYTLPDVPNFPIIIHEIDHGFKSCFAIYEARKDESEPRFFLERISLQQLQETTPNIEAKKAYEEGKRLIEEVRWGEGNRKRNYYKALDCFDKAISLDPTDYRFWHDRALLWCMLGDHKQAIPDYLQAYKLSGNLDYLVERACILIDCGRVEEAVPDLEFAASKGNLYAKQSLQRLAYGWDRDPDPHGGW